MSNVKRISLMCGMGLVVATASWLVGCGTGNNVVPQAPIGGVAGGYGVCSAGQSTYPINNGIGSYGCYPGYVFNGSTCICNSYGGYGYGYGNGYNNGYGNGYGYGTQILCNGTYVYSTTGYCPPGTVPGH